MTDNGGVPERPKGADCKSVVNDFGGSNPLSPTTVRQIAPFQGADLFYKRNAGVME
jgi:hypothetical protein